MLTAVVKRVNTVIEGKERKFFDLLLAKFPETGNKVARMRVIAQRYFCATYGYVRREGVSIPYEVETKATAQATTALRNARNRVADKQSRVRVPAAPVQYLLDIEHSLEGPFPGSDDEGTQ